MSNNRFLDCKCCGQKSLVKLIDFGNHPISTHYGDRQNNRDKFYKLSLGICESCELVQLIDYIPEKELLSAPDWITYNEPESHLDETVKEITSYLESKSLKIRGLSYKDESTIRRLNDLGYIDGKLFDFSFAGEIDVSINIERLQNIIKPEVCKKLILKESRADVLLVRHVLEHTFETNSFLSSIKNLVTKSGVVVFEIPDCTKQFKNLDYTCLWEDHTIYFVPETFKTILEKNGFKVVKLLNFDYSTENALVAICVLSENDSVIQDMSVVNKDPFYPDSVRAFSDGFHSVKSKVRNFVFNQKEVGKVALFGAGHLAGTFIHLFDLEKSIDFVVDDDVNKTGKYMPGTDVIIKSSATLAEEKIETCMLSLSPESEKKLFSKSAHLFRNTKSVKSIFPGKQNSVF